MTDTVQETDVNNSTSSLSPGDVLDIPLNGEDVTTATSSIQYLEDHNLNYLGTSVFDVDAMAPLSQKSMVIPT